MANRPNVSEHQLTDNVKLLQKAVLIHSGQVLLLQRSPAEQSRPNCWDTPGGNSQWPNHGDTPISNPHLQDLCREIQEETGLIVQPHQLNPQDLVYVETFYEPEREIYTVLFGWRILLPADLNRDQVQVSHEHLQAQWANPQEALEFDFGGARGEFMKRIIQSATQS